jgi:hypothetical protein
MQERIAHDLLNAVTAILSIAAVLRRQADVGDSVLVDDALDLREAGERIKELAIQLRSTR